MDHVSAKFMEFGQHFDLFFLGEIVHTGVEEALILLLNVQRVKSGQLFEKRNDLLCGILPLKIPFLGFHQIFYRLSRVFVFFNQLIHDPSRFRREILLFQIPKKDIPFLAMMGPVCIVRMKSTAISMKTVSTLLDSFDLSDLPFQQPEHPLDQAGLPYHGSNRLHKDSPPFLTDQCF
jgi:hypothetical protein